LEVGVKMDLKDFIEQNKEKIYKIVRKNTKYNKEGIPTISKNDLWFNENEWDEHFKTLNKESETNN
jgi:hypothetical protein